MPGALPLFLAFVSAASTMALLFALSHSRSVKLFLDRPNSRSMHIDPVPRIGGIAIMLSTMSVASFTFLGTIAVVFFTAITLSGVSAVDDKRGLPVMLRLGAHVTAGIVILLVLLPTEATDWYADILSTSDGIKSLLRIVLLLVGLVWATNLFNFMDGADGLAGGMGMIGFSAYAVAASIGDAVPLASFCGVIAGASAGFLVFNFPPARIFLGDAGSIPLGFLAATIGLDGALRGVWPWWFPFVVFSPFWTDATITLLKRLSRGAKVWVAHREHYYQRLILSGWSHRRTALAYYAVMALTALSSIAFMRHFKGAADILLTSWVVIYALLLCVLEWRLGQKKNENTEKHHEAP